MTGTLCDKKDSDDVGRGKCNVVNSVRVLRGTFLNVIRENVGGVSESDCETVNGKTPK